MPDITIPGMFLTGIHASRPAASAVGGGSIYSCTTHSLIYQSDGSSWTTWATLGGASDLDAIITASSGQDIADALAGAASPTSGNVFATMADVGGGGGGSSDPIADTFGAADTAFEFSSNSFTGLTAMGTADTESMHATIPGHLLLGDNDSEQVGRYASFAGGKSAIVKITAANPYADFMYAGMFCGVATPGKFAWVGLTTGTNTGGSIKAMTFTGPSDGSPGTIATGIPNWPGAFYPIYLGVKAVSNTDVSYYYSRDGIAWFLITGNHDNSMTIGSVGVSVTSYASTPTARAAFDYIRIWNSVKTFPTLI